MGNHIVSIVREWRIMSIRLYPHHGDIYKYFDGGRGR